MQLLGVKDSEINRRGTKLKKLGIGVGERNSYRHPAKEALQRTQKYTPHIYRTDQSGTIKITPKNGKLQIFTEK